ncbi:GGDEF domain-containing protein [Chitinibacter bivalviorum]|uniref:diguanylate cyclase n=1 Tax=Chitinibacter bivalviorum TaxID=2739434 RepID=A0A7H9BFR8_9NEIS|nr:GGDEF domain-containing protein [Chitinibacter bivalviorum]QLG87086.1 GGDEF domain-containing protein [Chitinibacter bivalviorum]
MSTVQDISNLNLRARTLLREHASEALACAQQAAVHAIELGYDLGFTESIFLQGSIISLQGNTEEGLPLMRHALYMANLHQFKTLIPDCLQEIARACYTTGDYDNALDAWFQCLDAALEIDAQDTYILGQIGLGQLYFAHDDFYHALNHHTKARDYAYQCQDPAILAAIEINIGVDQFELQQIDNAKKTLKQALVYAQQAKNLEYQAAAMGTLGRVALAERDFPLAHSYLERARGLNQRHQNNWGEAHNLYNLGLLALEEAQIDTAIQLFRTSLNIAQTMNAAHLVYLVELGLSKALEQKGDFENALKFHQQGYEHHYLILRQASPQRLHIMEAKLEAERTRNENKTLREQNSLEREARQHSEHIASQDPLTGLLNRRGLEARSSNMLRSNPEHRQPLALLMIDIDFFKAVNDRWGHLVGDYVLRQVAALLKSGCRQDDLVCRWGGEEFLILLPSRNGVSAQDVAERLRSMVEQWPWEKIEHGLQMTISVGVTHYQNDTQLTPLVQRADRHLYQAKQAGRNRVICAAAPPM